MSKVKAFFTSTHTCVEITLVKVKALIQILYPSKSEKLQALDVLRLKKLKVAFWRAAIFVKK